MRILFVKPVAILLVIICFLVPTLALSQFPPGASVLTKVQVPSSMRFAPFDVDRYLKVPPNFSIIVYARIGGARFMAIAPNGDLLVSQPGTGKVLLVQSNGSGDPLMSTFVDRLRLPHDLIFHTIDGITYLYIAERHQINRFVYVPGDTTAHDRQIVVTGLPDSSTPELQGAYGHELKNIALSANHKLYISIGSSCNASRETSLATRSVARSISTMLMVPTGGSLPGAYAMLKGWHSHPAPMTSGWWSTIGTISLTPTMTGAAIMVRSFHLT